jgi:predicted RNA binding protein YcfA (HicA-like mRNA interferase family)
VPPVPLIPSSDAIRVFRRLGYEVHHRKGSHIIMRRTTPPNLHLSIPDRRELARGTLRSLIRDARLTVEEFTKLLEEI